VDLQPYGHEPNGDKTMTDFNNWYAQQNPDLSPDLEDIRDELRKAYEAGAGPQSETLRDKFAGRVDGLHEESTADYAGFFNADKHPPMDNHFAWAKWFAKADATLRYIRADAMLEARKTTGEGRAIIIATTIALAIVKEQSERHGCDQAYYGPNGDGFSDYQFDGQMNLERIAEIINETMTTGEGE
jgi:hypothetical protein